MYYNHRYKHRNDEHIFLENNEIIYLVLQKKKKWRSIAVIYDGLLSARGIWVLTGGMHSVGFL